MAVCKLSPLFQDEQLDNNGLPLSGGKVYWYIAGTSTPVTTYTDINGSIAQTNPIILNTRGEPTYTIWLTTGQAYKAALYDAAGSLIRTIDNITGINDTPVQTVTEWLTFTGSPTYVNATSFTVTGNQTQELSVGRRIKVPVSGGTCYGTITSSVFTTVTTIVITADSTTLDNSITTLYYGFFNPLYPSYDIASVNPATKAAIQAQTYTYAQATGASGTYSAVATPAITAYVDGQRFSLHVQQSGSSTNTLSVNSLGAKPLKQYDQNGAYVDTVIKADQIIEVQYSTAAVSGGGFVVLNPLPSALNDSLYVHADGAETITGVKTFTAGAEPAAKNFAIAWANIAIRDGTSGDVTTPRAYAVVSNVCTITNAGHTVPIGARIKVTTVTGTLPVGVYVVSGITSTTYEFAVTTVNTAGNLTVDGIVKNGYNIDYAEYIGGSGGGTGFFKIYPLSPYPNANYCIVATSDTYTIRVEGTLSTSKTTTLTQLKTWNGAATPAGVNARDINIVIFGA
ncbi:MAG: hypothetical protein WC449_05850 [Candidatus Paceibacterota bacterium]